MKKLFAFLTVICLSTSFLTGLMTPAHAGIKYNIFNFTDEEEVEPVVVKKANRLLVISEKWCYWCRILDPHIQQLKDEGYEVHTFTMKAWKKAKPKPDNLPKKLSGNFGIPVILFVRADVGVNVVIKDDVGGEDKTADYLKKYLDKPKATK